MEGDEKPEFWLMQNSYAHLAKVAKKKIIGDLEKFGIKAVLSLTNRWYHSFGFTVVVKREVLEEAGYEVPPEEEEKKKKKKKFSGGLFDLCDPFNLFNLFDPCDLSMG